MHKLNVLCGDDSGEHWWWNSKYKLFLVTHTKEKNGDGE